MLTIATRLATLSLISIHPAHIHGTYILAIFRMIEAFRFCKKVHIAITQQTLTSIEI